VKEVGRGFRFPVFFCSMLDAFLSRGLSFFVSVQCFEIMKTQGLFKMHEDRSGMTIANEMAPNNPVAGLHLTIAVDDLFSLSPLTIAFFSLSLFNSDGGCPSSSPPVLPLEGHVAPLATSLCSHATRDVQLPGERATARAPSALTEEGLFSTTRVVFFSSSELLLLGRRVLSFFLLRARACFFSHIFFFLEHKASPCSSCCSRSAARAPTSLFLAFFLAQRGRG
jgi:hypothetical protein